MSMLEALNIRSTGQEEAINRQIILKHYITGLVKESDFELRVSKTLLWLHPASTSVLVKNLYLSPDPYIRSRRPNASNRRPLHRPIFAWRGMPGLTAYAGFYKIGHPLKAGDQLFVSGATGAVGHLVGQLGKISGCYVVGAAGSDEKVQLLKQTLGFDDAFNYKEEANLQASLRRHIPKKVDIYWESVGGKLLEAVLENINKFGRIIACGMISQYNLEKPEGVSNLFRVVGKSLTMQGFIAWDYNYLYDEFTEKMSKLLKEKRLLYLEDVTKGLENAVQAFIDLFKGQNIGKKVVKICDP